MRLLFPHLLKQNLGSEGEKPAGESTVGQESPPSTTSETGAQQSETARIAPDPVATPAPEAARVEPTALQPEAAGATARPTPEMARLERELNDKQQALRERELLLNSREQALAAREQSVLAREQAAAVPREQPTSEPSTGATDEALKREETRLKEWKRQLAESAAHLEELFSRSDRFGLRQSAGEAAHIVEQLGGAAPGAPAPSSGSSIEEVVEVPAAYAAYEDSAGEGTSVWDEVEARPMEAGIEARFGTASPEPAMTEVIRRRVNEIDGEVRRDESVLFADMRRLRLLPDGESAESDSEHVLD